MNLKLIELITYILVLVITLFVIFYIFKLNSVKIEFYEEDEDEEDEEYDEEVELTSGQLSQREVANVIPEEVKLIKELQDKINVIKRIQVQQDAVEAAANRASNTAGDTYKQMVAELERRRGNLKLLQDLMDQLSKIERENEKKADETTDMISDVASTDKTLRARTFEAAQYRIYNPAAEDATLDELLE
jgi:uncharacterized phage infection (PIP) family protein YhgE